MKLFDIMINTRYELVKGGNADVKGLTIDSRFVSLGDMFFCIHGLHSNGHAFIEAAAKRGAVAIVVEEEQPAYPPGVAVLKVANTRRALAYAAANYFGDPAGAMTLVGVTGTNGKTSVTYFMEAVLNAWGKKTGVIGTVETRIGNENANVYFATSTTPDTIELHKIFSKMKERQVSHVAMEVSSHALALYKTEGVRFQAGVFTNISQDHLDFHGTMKEYMETKARLFQSCEYGVFNIDDEVGAFMMKNAGCKTITYSIDEPSELQAKNARFSARGVEFDLAIDGELVHFTSPVPGKFTVYNMLGAIGAAAALNIPIPVIQKGLADMRGVPGRIQRVPNDRDFTVIVDYAHTPDGLSNILQAVREFTTGSIITVFGCGGDRDRGKRPLMGNVAGKLSNYCVVTSDNPRTEEPAAIMDEIEAGLRETSCAYEKVEDRRDAIFRAVGMARPGDSVVIAGKGHENYQIFATQTVDFDDCETAAEAIKALG